MSRYVLFFFLFHLECHTVEFIISKTSFKPTVSPTTINAHGRTKSEAHDIY